MCKKTRHNYVSFDIDTNCVEIFIEKKEDGTKHFIKGIEYGQKNLSHQKSECIESENRSRTSVKKRIRTLARRFTMTIRYFKYIKMSYLQRENITTKQLF